MEKRIMWEISINEYRAKLVEEEKSPGTIEKYTNYLKQFEQFMAGEGLVKEKVIIYKRHLMESYAPSSVNVILSALNGFFRFVGRYDCLVKAVRVQRQIFRPRDRELSRAEYYRLVSAAERKGDRRLSLIMQTICSTGIRVSELRYISVEALKAGRAGINMKGKCRQILIPKALVKTLLSYASEHNIRSGSIFVTKKGNPMDRSNILHEMKKLCTLARVNKRKVFPHNLRHLFACLYYQAEKDLCHLADILGHSSVETTRIYTSISGAAQQRRIERLKLVAEPTQTPQNNHYAKNFYT